MPPRMQPRSTVLANLRSQSLLHSSRRYATVSTISPIAPHEQLARSPIPTTKYPPTQPPSYKPPEFRKSQLLRQYASLLRSTPLILLFQHNNLKSNEWAALRRELMKALAKVDDTMAAAGHPSAPLQDAIKIQIIQTGIFAAAVRVVEFHKPENSEEPVAPSELTHTLSAQAHHAAAASRGSHDLEPLLAGPLALVTFPNVSPLHLKAVLQHLSPSAPQFPAPTRRANPGWHDVAVQNGLQKLLLLGARVEGKVFDVDGAKWVGGIDGGMDGLRAQLMAMLQGIGAGVTNTLESAGKGLYFTVEGRRSMLEGKGNGTKTAGEELKSE